MPLRGDDCVRLVNRKMLANDMSSVLCWVFDKCESHCNARMFKVYSAIKGVQKRQVCICCSSNDYIHPIVVPEIGRKIDYSIHRLRTVTRKARLLNVIEKLELELKILVLCSFQIVIIIKVKVSSNPYVAWELSRKLLCRWLGMVPLETVSVWKLTQGIIIRGDPVFQRIRINDNFMNYSQKFCFWCWKCIVKWHLGLLWIVNRCWRNMTWNLEL